MDLRRLLYTKIITEKAAFLCMAFLVAFQFVLNDTLITYDGPSHVYNASIIKEKLFFGNHFYSVFQFNLTPNWSSHFILAILQLFFSAFLAERIFLFFLILFFLFSFRYALESRNGINKSASWFGLLVVFNVLFYLGFYNFILGLSAGFMLMGLRFQKSMRDFIVFLVCMFFWILIAFSHAFVYLLIIGLLAWELLFYRCWPKFFKQMDACRKELPIEKKIMAIKLSSAIIPGFLVIHFLLLPLPDKVYTYLTSDQVTDLILGFKTFVVFNSSKEHMFILLPFTLAVISIFIEVFIRFNRQVRFNRVGASSMRGSIFWIPVLLGSLILCYIVPDSDRYVGFVSVRMVLLTFIFFVFLFSTMQISKLTQYVVVFSIVLSVFVLQKFRLKEMNTFGPSISSLRKAGSLIKDDKYVLLYAVENHWFLRHTGMLAFEDKRVISLDNYEAELPLFPVSWNKNALPDIRVGNKASAELTCFKWETNRIAHVHQVEYVLLFGNEDRIRDSCELEMWMQVKQQYTLIYSNEHVVLMNLKKSV